MARLEGLFGTSLCLTLRARVARAKLFQTILSNPEVLIRASRRPI